MILTPREYSLLRSFGEAAIRCKEESKKQLPDAVKSLDKDIAKYTAILNVIAPDIPLSLISWRKRQWLEVWVIREEKRIREGYDHQHDDSIMHWLTLGKDEANYYHYRDELTQLKVKLYPKRNKKPRYYADEFLKIARLKEAPELLLYGVDSQNIYKLTFLCRNNVDCNIELQLDPPTMKSLEFCKHRKKWIQQEQDHFGGYLANRQEATRLLQETKKQIMKRYHEAFSIVFALLA